jgi:hypothetical protein
LIWKTGELTHLLIVIQLPNIFQKVGEKRILDENVSTHSDLVIENETLKKTKSDLLKTIITLDQKNLEVLNDLSLNWLEKTTKDMTNDRCPYFPVQQVHI